MTSSNSEFALCLHEVDLIAAPWPQYCHSTLCPTAVSCCISLHVASVNIIQSLNDICYKCQLKERKCLLFFSWYWCLNSGPHVHWAGALPLEPHLQPWRLFTFSFCVKCRQTNMLPCVSSMFTLQVLGLVLLCSVLYCYMCCHGSRLIILKKVYCKGMMSVFLREQWYKGIGRILNWG
jgi:hypothetical protein